MAATARIAFRGAGGLATVLVPGATATILGPRAPRRLTSPARRGLALCSPLLSPTDGWAPFAAQPSTPQAAQRPAGSRGSCPPTGINYFAARSWPSEKSVSKFAVAERLLQFAVVDGTCGDDRGASAAEFCARQMPRLTAFAFHEQISQRPLWTRTAEDGERLGEAEAAAAAWADALTLGFDRCDQVVRTQTHGGCGAVLCTVARSGVYVASVGLGRAVIGTAEDAFGETLMCDEASIPHSTDSELERERLGPGVKIKGPTRLLGGAAEKDKEPRLLSLPDVAHFPHADTRRLVILGSPGVWAWGPRLPVEWAVEALRAGRSPADELISRAEGDAVVLVLVLPPGLGQEGSALPGHGEVAIKPPGQ